jgi:hypothetical protein
MHAMHGPGRRIQRLTPAVDVAATTRLFDRFELRCHRLRGQALPSF